MSTTIDLSGQTANFDCPPGVHENEINSRRDNLQMEKQIRALIRIPL
jgi:hypothetical protein